MRTGMLGFFATLLLYVALFFSFGVGVDIGKGKPDEPGFLAAAFVCGFGALFVAGVVGRDSDR